MSYDEEEDSLGLGQAYDLDEMGVPDTMAVTLGGDEISEAHWLNGQDSYNQPASASDLQNTWKTVTAAFPSERVAGQKLIERVKVAASDTIPLFRKNSTAMGYHVWATLTDLVMNYQKPDAFRVIVEEIALRHMGTPMTEFQVRVFRDALIGHCAEAVGDEGLEALSDMLSPLVGDIGAACIKMREGSVHNVDLILSSWQMIRKQESTDVVFDTEALDVEEKQKKEADADSSDSDTGDVQRGNRKKHNQANSFEGDSGSGEKGEKQNNNMLNIAVPKTFRDMLMFNAVVMQIGNRKWLPVLMEAMDGLATSISRPARFQEEIDVLALQLARFPGYNLEEFRSVMLASMRSLLSSSMDARFEQAWSWFWQLLKRKLAELPPDNIKAQQKTWKKFIGGLPEEKLESLKLAVFESFFHSCEEASEYLKVSNSKLSSIMQRILDMISTLYDDGLAAVKDLSALGLTHAGWGIKPELLPLLIDAVMLVIKEETHDKSLAQGAWWSLDLIARILDRTLLEGSTDVMRAIALNSGKMLRKSVARVGRGRRAQGLLNIRVGTESISPLLWAVETNALSTASAILADLLAIRADRMAYYFGMDALFDRHADIVEVLCRKAPTLLPQLFDGLIWRSNKTENGQRRVNYYIGRVFVDTDATHDKVSLNSFAALIAHGDPGLILHPLPTFMLNLLWVRCGHLFFLTKVWFLITLIDYIVGLQYGILMFDSAGPGRWALISCRLFMYTFSAGQLLYKHTRLMVQTIRRRSFVRVGGMIRMPEFLVNSRQNCIEVLLCLFLLIMLATEPFFHCLKVNPAWVTNCCYADEFYCKLSDSYDRISSIPQVLYFCLFADMLHLNLYLSTFFVIFLRLLGDFLTFIATLIFVAIVFASGIACLPQTGDFQIENFYNFPSAFISLMRMALNAYGSEEEIASGPQDLALYVILFRICSQLIVLNAMVAQLVSSFSDAHTGAFGQACLLRGFNILHIALPLMSAKRWRTWVTGLGMKQPTELDKGEFGPAGGIQIMESAVGTGHLTLDCVRRFGGLTSPSLPWPEEHCSEDKESEVAELRKLLEERFAALAKLKAGGGAARGGSGKGDSGKGGSAKGSGSQYNSEGGSRMASDTDQ